MEARREHIPLPLGNRNNEDTLHKLIISVKVLWRPVEIYSAGANTTQKALNFAIIYNLTSRQ